MIDKNRIILMINNSQQEREIDAKTKCKKSLEELFHYIVTFRWHVNNKLDNTEFIYLLDDYLFVYIQNVVSKMHTKCCNITDVRSFLSTYMCESVK